MSLKIINIQGTTKYGGTNWLQEWENATGRRAMRCAEMYCDETDGCEGPHKKLVGAHVQIEGGRHSKWYIVPLCKAGNNTNYKGVTVREDTLFMGVTDGQVYSTDDLRAELDD